jgi:hypothetical protein
MAKRKQQFANYYSDDTERLTAQRKANKAKRTLVVGIEPTTV